MSRSLNQVTLLGNLGADPEIRTTATGAKVATLSLATSRTWTGRDGQQQSRTDWHRIVVWGSYVEVLAKYARKGTQLHVSGSLEYRSYEDRNGVTRWITEINARDVILLGGDRRAATPPTPEDIPLPEERREDASVDSDQMVLIGAQ